MVVVGCFVAVVLVSGSCSGLIVLKFFVGIRILLLFCRVLLPSSF